MEDIIYTNEFEQIASQGFVIWGAGGKGKACYDMLKEYGQSEHIRYFVDSNPQKQGQTINLIKVIAPEDLKEMSPLPIVISTFVISSVYKSIRETCLENPVYVFRIFGGISSVHQLSREKEEVLSLYDNRDDDTKKLVHLMWESGRARGLYEIQPYKIAMRYLPDAQYWTEKGTCLKKHKEITVIDAGAYIGDTLLQLQEVYRSSLSQYYGFEPEAEAFSDLQRCIASNEIKEHATIYNMGLSDQARGVSFYASGKGSSRIREEGETDDSVINTICLDSLAIKVNGKLCIKLDIEGSELAALKGAANTIEKYKPEMAICLYHLTDDAYTIAQYIKSTWPDYRLIIRGGTHAVCYASYEKG